MLQLKSNHFDEAIRLFKSIETYRDSKEKIAFCTEEKENIRKESIYSQTMQQLSRAKTSSSVKYCIDKLRPISGFKDVDEQLEYLSVRFKQLKEKEIKDKEEAEKARKRRKKTTLICLSIVAAMAVILFLMFNLIIPTIRYNKANQLAYEGRYDEAKEIYLDLGDFSESDRKLQILKIIDRYILDDEPYFQIGIRKLLYKKVDVTLTYETNGGIFVNHELTEKYTSPGEFYEIYTPSKDGYYFDKWQLANCSYKSNDTFELTLTAIYSVKEYSIQYQLNGGQLNIDNPTEYDVEDETFTLVNPTRIGYTFAGWSGTELSEPTVNVTVSTGSYGDRNYTATWTVNEYTVTYDAAGGTIISETQKVYYDSNVEYLVPERAGYKFLGWYENATKHENEKWTRTSDLSLVAKWEIVKYTITYNLNGSESSPLTPSEYTVEDDITLSAPTKDGYTFIGWTSQEDDIPALNVVISGDTIGDKIYTANFEPCLNSLKFDANGGNGFMPTISINTDQSILAIA